MCVGVCVCEYEIASKKKSEHKIKRQRILLEIWTMEYIECVVVLFIR